MESYKIQSKLGSGNFANVYLATHLPTQQEVALKMICKKGLNIKNLQRVQREISNMKTVGSHDSIVTLIETFETSEHFVLAMEYLPGGELFDHVLDRDGLSETDAKELFRELACAVQHCHNNGIAHRDLKLENILLDSKNRPKIADFGLSKQAHNHPIYATYCGSPLYTAPEIMHERQYRGPECDIWSMGVILYTMLTATMPFDDTNFTKFMFKIEKGEYSKPEGVSTDAQEIISKMLCPCTEARYNINQVLNHPWLATPSQRRRKLGVCLVAPPQLKVTGVCDCDCTCHKNEPHTHRDSVITKHCSDCEEIIANSLDFNKRQIPQLSRNSSTTSSGYGSEFGSQYLPIESLKPRFRPLLDIEERRYSLPRKGKVSTHNSRNSVPSHPLVATPAYSTTTTCGLEEEDDNTVFI